MFVVFQENERTFFYFHETHFDFLNRPLRFHLYLRRERILFIYISTAIRGDFKFTSSLKSLELISNFAAILESLYFNPSLILKKKKKSCILVRSSSNQKIFIMTERVRNDAKIDKVYVSC